MQHLDVGGHRGHLHAGPARRLGDVLLRGQQRVAVHVLGQSVPVILLEAREGHDGGHLVVDGGADEEVQALDEHVGRGAAEDDVVFIGGKPDAAGGRADLGAVLREHGGDLPDAEVGQVKLEGITGDLLLDNGGLGRLVAIGHACGELDAVRTHGVGNGGGDGALVCRFLREADFRRVGRQSGGGQQRQHHAENEQKAPNTFFHLFLLSLQRNPEGVYPISSIPCLQG